MTNLTVTKEEKASETPTSAAPKGTVLKGLNVLQGASDPIALADQDYPPWLWKLLDTKKVEWKPEEQISREHFKAENRKRILAVNTARSK